MKRFRFLIVALGLFAVQGVFAVTLPSTSYSPYSSSSSYSEVQIYGSGTVITGSFNELGTATDVCTTEGEPGVPPEEGTCEECCSKYFGAKDPAGNLACVSSCEQGASLPLDAPLWFMLALAAAFAVMLSVAKHLAIRERAQKLA